jgi:hypothetical protein
MSVSVSWNLFRCIVNFSGTKELLSIWILIKHNTKTSCHIYNLSTSVIIYILTRILTTITIYIFKFISFIRLWFVYFRMIRWLYDSTNPRFNRHKFFTFYLTLNNLKAINLRVLNKFTRLFSLFVNSNADWYILLRKLWRLTPSSSTLRFIWLTSSHENETFKKIIIKQPSQAYFQM